MPILPLISPLPKPPCCSVAHGVAEPGGDGDGAANWSKTLVGSGLHSDAARSPSLAAADGSQPHAPRSSSTSSSSSFFTHSKPGSIDEWLGGADCAGATRCQNLCSSEGV